MKRSCWLRFEQLEARDVPATLRDDGNFVLEAELNSGITDPAVPVYYDGVLHGTYNVIEGSQRVPNTSSYPQYWAFISNGYFRQTYTLGTATAPFGTTVSTALAYRTNTALNLVPTISRIDIRYVSNTTIIEATGIYDDGTTKITLTIPLQGSNKKATANVEFIATSDITLSNSLFGQDALRGPTFSSMNVSSTEYDVSDFIYKDNNQVAQRLPVNPLADNQHFFAAPWLLPRNFPAIHAVKAPGSSWFGDSPSVHVTIKKGTIQLPNTPATELAFGMQGYRFGSTNPNDDNVSSWFEMLGTPNMLTTGTLLKYEFELNASASPALNGLLAGPAVLAPVGAISNPKPTLLWSSVIGASKYEYQIVNANTVVQTGFAPTEYKQITTALLKGTYKLRVRTYNSANEPGAWGPAKAFTVTIPAPIVLGPTGVLDDRTPTITFTPQVSDATSDIAIFKGTVRVHYATNIADTEYTVPNGLGQGSHRVYVRSKNPQGEYSAWSKPASFKIDIPTPVATTGLTPLGTQTSVTPLFTWNSVPYGRFYDLRIDDLTTGQNAYIKRRIEGTSWQRDYPFPPHQYRWWVRASNEFGEASAWVQVGTFQIQGDVLADMAGAKNWLTYAPRNYNPDLGQFPTLAQIRADLQQLYAEGWRSLMTWTMDGTLGAIPHLAKEAGFSYVVAGIYYYDAAQLAREYAACIDQQEYVDAFIVGNEGLQIGQRYTLAQIQQVMSDLKTATGKPVATCETGGFLIQHPELLQEGDFVLTNIHPWWANIRTIPEAVQHTANEYNAIEALMPPGKLLYMRETWWPTGSDAAATPALQDQYYKALAGYNLLYAYGEAYDQPFKITNGEPPWGLHTSTGTAKVALKAIKTLIRDPR